MGDMGDLFNEWHKIKQEKRANNKRSSTIILDENGISYKPHNNGIHLIIKHNGFIVDFWPSTGKYIVHGSKKYKRGIYRLLRDIK